MRRRKPKLTAAGWEVLDGIQAAHLETLLPEVFFQMSDRASVLVVAALVDSALERLLRALFMQISEVTKEDCDFLLTKRPLPPLGSAYIRASLAFTLGYIGRDTYNALKYVTTIRNKCAHEEIAPPITEDIGTRLYELLSRDEREIADYILERATVFYRERNRPERPSNLFLSGCIATWVTVDAERFWLETKLPAGVIPNPPPPLE
jgi:DNA-binding MltR family transcriptional regulator